MFHLEPTLSIVYSFYRKKNGIRTSNTPSLNVNRS